MKTFGKEECGKATPAEGKDGVKSPVAGCGSITREQIDAIIDEFCEKGDEEISITEYYHKLGFICALSFVSCPEEAETHGFGAFDFEMNSYLSAVHDDVHDIIANAVEDMVADKLESLGMSGRVKCMTAEEAAERFGKGCECDDSCR